MTNEITAFYGWWQFATCLFAFVALLSIWWHIGKKQNDFGQVWLALSILCWSLSGLVEVFYASKNFTSSIYFNGWRSILSLFNSLFILLALPWFRYLPKFLLPIIKSNYWKYIVGLPFLFSLLPTISAMLFKKDLGAVSELDVYYAFLTLVFLGCVLWESFEKRRLKALAWLTVVSILMTIIAQGYKLTDAYINLTLFSAIFKTSLIMLFFALALSWVKELTENMLPNASLLYIKFQKIKTDDGTIERNIFLKGLLGKSEQKIALTQASYKLMLEFASRKKTSEGWLEIKPKNASLNKTFDINDYNEIKRLLISILDSIFGEGNWTKNKHFDPLKSALFEKSEQRNRKIRLSIPPENIYL